MKAWLIDETETPVRPLERKVKDGIFGVEGEEMQLSGADKAGFYLSAGFVQDRSVHETKKKRSNYVPRATIYLSMVVMLYREKVYIRKG